MSGWFSYFTGRKNVKEGARDSIINLRQSLLTLEKKEEYLNKQIEDDLKKARANATTNKQAATHALRQKKLHEDQLDKLAGMRLTLETQINALESANLNAETMAAMKQGADALKSIHQTLKVDKVDETMDSIREQMDVANEISEAISNPVGMGATIDEDELQAELEALEQEELDDRLKGANHVPSHMPALPASPIRQHATADEDDEEAQLRKLQAELAG
ncbi:late endosome to vacuole transport-related protein [Trichosporon asahii var. asahii CBS 8904]|uniref:Vacuolar-sorting protein SNF7 n=2 Tax=Trichosporon asahii var. asahii TaxID=189963 RepID=K1WDP9_TRIAC|nr:late endosome to vacuole transport-related protein [Trichosporon asahii var. asahii CBS 8904]